MPVQRESQGQAPVLLLGADSSNTWTRSYSGFPAKFPGVGTWGFAKEARRDSAREIDGCGQGFTLLATGRVRGIV